MESSLDNKLKNFPYKLILGSASPRRQELLKSMGFHFTVQPTHADESYAEDLKAEEIPKYLAEKTFWNSAICKLRKKGRICINRRSELDD